MIGFNYTGIGAIAIKGDNVAIYKGELLEVVYAYICEYTGCLIIRRYMLKQEMLMLLKAGL